MCRRTIRCHHFWFERALNFWGRLLQAINRARMIKLEFYESTQSWWKKRKFVREFLRNIAIAHYSWIIFRLSECRRNQGQFGFQFACSHGRRGKLCAFGTFLEALEDHGGYYHVNHRYLQKCLRIHLVQINCFIQRATYCEKCHFSRCFFFFSKTNTHFTEVGQMSLDENNFGQKWIGKQLKFNNYFTKMMMYQCTCLHLHWILLIWITSVSLIFCSLLLRRLVILAIEIHTLMICPT